MNQVVVLCLLKQLRKIRMEMLRMLMTQMGQVQLLLLQEKDMSSGL